MVVENLGNAESLLQLTGLQLLGAVLHPYIRQLEVCALKHGPNKDIGQYLPVSCIQKFGGFNINYANLCIGSGSETYPKPGRYFHGYTTVELFHARPPNAHSWQIEADLPANWKSPMEYGRVNDSIGWEWSSGGNAVINGSSIELNDPVRSYVVDYLIGVTSNTVPFRHVFNAR